MNDTSDAQAEWIGHVVLALAIALVVTTFLTNRSGRRKTFPVASGAVPLLGHILHLADSDQFLAVLTKWADEVGGEEGIYEFSLLGRRFVVLCSSDAVMDAMRLRPLKMRRATVLDDVVGGLGIHGVFNAEGKAWARQRKIVAPALNAKNVRDYFPALKLAAGRLVAKWGGDTGAVCALSDLSNHSLDVVALAILGMDLNSLNHPESTLAQSVRDVFHVTFVRSLAPFPYWKIPLIGANLDGGRTATNQVLQKITDLVHSYRIRNRNPYYDTDKETKAFLEKLVDMTDRDNAKLSDEEVVGNLAEMVTAGTDTTSNTIAFCLWEIACDAKLQAELREEIVEAGISPGELTLDDVNERFPRLHSLMFEVFRVKGPAPILFLEPAAALEFRGETIEPGTVVVLLTRSFRGNGSAEIPNGPSGEGPEQFCPQRWLVSENDSESNDPFKVAHPSNKLGGYLPFGHGVRICPGKQLAEIEILTSLIFVLHKFEVALAPDHPPLTPVTRFTETFDKEMKLLLTERL